MCRTLLGALMAFDTLFCATSSFGSFHSPEVGVVGVAWAPRIMAIKCFDMDGWGSDSDCLAGLEYRQLPQPTPFWHH